LGVGGFEDGQELGEPAEGEGMNRDDMINMAREAGVPYFDQYDRQLECEAIERFAQLVAARVAGEIANDLEAAVNVVSHEPTKKLVVGLANAIRNRGTA
jgi:hypothetical protein